MITFLENTKHTSVTNQDGEKFIWTLHWSSGFYILLSDKVQEERGYFEVHIGSVAFEYFNVGFDSLSTNTSYANTGGSVNARHYRRGGNVAQKNIGSTITSFGKLMKPNDVIGIGYDFNTGEMDIYHNSEYQGTLANDMYNVVEPRFYAGTNNGANFNISLIQEEERFSYPVPAKYKDVFAGRKILLKSDSKIYSLKSEEILHETRMTSNTAPAPFVASASSVYSTNYPAWKAFNGVTEANSSSNHFWMSADNKIPMWLSINYGTPKEVNFLDIYVPTDANPLARLKDFIIQGSNDGLSWDDLKNFTNEQWDGGYKKRIYLGKIFRYSQYRLYITSLHGFTRTSVVALVYGREENLTELPSDSVENFINYGTSSIEHFNLINGGKEYVLQDTVSENADGLWVQELDRKPLSIKFEQGVKDK